MSKKFKAFISSLCVLSCAFAVSMQVSASSFLTGDLNGDGQLTAEDALLILQNVVGISDSFPVDDMETPSGNIIANVTTEDCSRDITYDGNTAVSLSLKYPVVEIVGNKNASKAINQTLQRVRLQQNIIDELYSETIEAWSYNYSQEDCSGYYISYDVYRNSNILSIGVIMSRYLIQSAHPSYGISTFNFDLTTGSLIEMTDITSINNYTTFIYDYASPAVFNRVSKYGFISSQDSMPSYLNENWYINPEGELVYVFSPYEVASYSDGIVEANIGKIDKYMTDYYKNLLK